MLFRDRDVYIYDISGGGGGRRGRLYFRLQEISIFFSVSQRKTTGHDCFHVLELQQQKQLSS